MNGCDAERERIRQSIKARVSRMTEVEREATKGLQEAYEQRRRAYLVKLYGEPPRIQPETAHAEAEQDRELPTYLPTRKTLL